MNISRTFNRRFLYSCAAFALLSGHTQAAREIPATDASITATTAAEGWSWPRALPDLSGYVPDVGAYVTDVGGYATYAMGAVGSVLPWSTPAEAPPVLPAVPAPAPGLLASLYDQLPGINLTGSLRYALTPIIDTTYYVATELGHFAVKTYVEGKRYWWADYCNTLFHDALLREEDAFTNLKQMSQNDPIAKAYVAIVLSLGKATIENQTTETPRNLANEALEYLRYWNDCGIGEATIALGELYEESLAHPAGGGQDHDAYLREAERLYKAAESYPEGLRRLNLFRQKYGSFETTL
jgi:hypothetical protein